MNNALFLTISFDRWRSPCQSQEEQMSCTIQYVKFPMEYGVSHVNWVFADGCRLRWNKMVWYVSLFSDILAFLMFVIRLLGRDNNDVDSNHICGVTTKAEYPDSHLNWKGQKMRNALWNNLIEQTSTIMTGVQKMAHQSGCLCLGAQDNSVSTHKLWNNLIVLCHEPRRLNMVCNPKKTSVLSVCS